MGKVRIVVNPAAVKELLQSDEVLADVTRRTEAIEQACNQDSSWGGYASEVEMTEDGPVGRVWSFDERADEARAQRILRNLDAAR